MINKKQKNTSQDNIAEFQHTIKNHCDCCVSPLLFQMQDKYHEFSLDVLTILRCLHLAEEQGAVPTLGDEFWRQVEATYHLK